MKAGTMVEEQLKGAEELVQLANIKQQNEWFYQNN
jgi:hypothetical protein